ncbi:VIT and vWA domain-containing protein [Vibrio japonicus]|uniref:VIT and VWA domain-containing protein n=1 Tax=Vibrio japonicus TaxID=1824638 RepID=A0ABY5LHT0_9VIBR|nr:VIT and VWA domain-containing protein [Vibrio japonicus]UUM31569.1 VIT and VWA domain-containing protein [Vibrio japonicus]
MDHHPLSQLNSSVRRVIDLTCSFILIIFAVLISPNLFAAGLLKPSDAKYQSLTIKTHHVDVVIQDGIATTTIEQTFANPNDHELEALYTFPVPEQAVVGEFIYWINGQPVIAEAVKKQQARQIYDDQKAQGRSTALTEKDGYKAFSMRVFPVLPNQSVKVRLVYLQDAILDHGVGRYVYPMEEGGTDAAADSFWTRNDRVEQDFSFTMTLKSGYPVDGVRLPAHPKALLSHSPDGEHTIWSAQLGNLSTNVDGNAGIEESDKSAIAQPSNVSNAPAFNLNQDIVAYWRLAEGVPGRVDMLAYRDPQESDRGTVKITFTPGDDLSAITQPRDWVFILDRSGSMQGKYATLAEGVKKALHKLPTQDRFQIIMFDDSVVDVTNGYQAVTPERVNQAIEKMNTLGVGGGTNLYAGLKKGLRNLDDDRVTGVVLVTDGVANVGTTEKSAFLKLVEQADVRLFTFIMGNSANRPLLEPMTKISDGFAASVSNSDDIMGHLMNATSKLNHHAYRDIELKVNGAKITDLTPQDIRSLYRGEQLTVLGHYFKPGQAKLTLSMKIAGHEKQYTTEVTLPEKATEHPELERIWAFSAIRDLEETMNYFEHKDSDSQQAIEDIALEYGLLTDYTSLLVVEEQVFEELGIERRNQQRVEKEQQARQQRESAPTESRRADKGQPMFNDPAPSHSGGGSGGGSIGWLSLLGFIGLAWARRTPKKNKTQ